jgi:hypothetical protein
MSKTYNAAAKRSYKWEKSIRALLGANQYRLLDCRICCLLFFCKHGPLADRWVPGFVIKKSPPIGGDHIISNRIKIIL